MQITSLFCLSYYSRVPLHFREKRRAVLALKIFEYKFKLWFLDVKNRRCALHKTRRVQPIAPFLLLPLLFSILLAFLHWGSIFPSLSFFRQ